MSPGGLHSPPLSGTGHPPSFSSDFIHFIFLYLDGLVSFPLQPCLKHIFYDYAAFSALELYHSGLQPSSPSPPPGCN